MLPSILFLLAEEGGVVAVGTESVAVVQTIDAKPVSVAVDGSGVAVGRECWGSMVSGYGWSGVVGDGAGDWGGSHGGDWSGHKGGNGWSNLIGCDPSHSWGCSNQRSSCYRSNWSSGECYCWSCSNTGDWSANHEASRGCDRVSGQPRGVNDAITMDEPAEDWAGQSQEKEDAKSDHG
uniref:Putative secreted protein n=1 Tax=Ixodes ricinus TaxID=34613 RepID=A0A6B0UYU4_IXORI